MSDYHVDQQRQLERAAEQHYTESPQLAPDEPTINLPLTCGWCRRQFTELAEFDGETPVCPRCIHDRLWADTGRDPCLNDGDCCKFPRDGDKPQDLPRPGDKWRKLAAFIDDNPECSDKVILPHVNLFPATLAEMAMLQQRYQCDTLVIEGDWVVARRVTTWGCIDVNMRKGAKLIADGGAEGDNAKHSIRPMI